MVIFKLYHSYMPTTLYFSYFHTNSIAMLYLMHKYKKKFESTNTDLTHAKIMIFSSFSSYGVWLFNKSYNCAVHNRLQI